MRRELFVRSFLIPLAVVSLLLLGTRILCGDWVGAVTGAWLVSPAAMILATAAEWWRTPEPRPNFGSHFSLRTQSWALVIGDTICLPFSAAMLALGFAQRQSQPLPMAAWWWMGVAWLLAACVAVGFHHKFDITQYDPRAKTSPAKYTHDYLAMFVLCGVFFWILPLGLLSSVMRPYAYLACIGLAVWAALGLCDARRGLRGRDQHRMWDWGTMRVIPYPAETQ